MMIPAFLAILLPALACDILNPETRGPEDLLRYVQRAQQRAQIIQRIWPELAPRELTTSPALGAPALNFTLLATASVTRTSDLPDTLADGNTSECDPDACTVTWSFGEQNRTFVRASYVAGRASGFEQRITEPPFGTWRTWFDATGQSTAGTLDPESASPISIWSWWRSGDGFSGQISQPGSAFGGWKISNNDITGQTHLEPLRHRFPWRAWPVTASIDLTAAGVWTRDVRYADGASTFAVLDTRRPRWIWNGPGVAHTSTTFTSGLTTFVTDFAVDQVLLQVETRIERGVTGATVREQQVNRLGARTTFELQVVPLSTRSRTFWLENGHASGSADVLVDGPGWRVDAFWDLADGSLVTLQARVFPSGIWSGSFSGWGQEDQDDPREQGEFLMLPDGSWTANVLLRQSDGSFAELPLALPPEGASARSVE